MNFENINFIGISISVILIITLLYFIIIRNMLIERKKKIERNKSVVDVFLKKRYDLIPNLVEICKGYSNYELNTLEKISQLRSTFNEKPSQETDDRLYKYYQELIAIIENYPKLKASENYLKLQKELVNVENEIQASRRIFINSITNYNNLVMKFPSSVIASICGYKEISLPNTNYEEVQINFK